MTVVAVAKKRNELGDTVLLKLVRNSWEILDLSGSQVSDIGLEAVSNICIDLRAIDISRCKKITPFGVPQVLRYCPLLETLRWGGCPASEGIARGSLSFLRPTLVEVEVDSWEEEEDITEFAPGPHSLRWLVWPKIDKDSYESLVKECPRVVINPNKPLSLRNWMDIPEHALPGVVLDASFLKDIDPRTWDVPVSKLKTSAPIEGVTAQSGNYVLAPPSGGLLQHWPLPKTSSIELPTFVERLASKPPTSVSVFSPVETVRMVNCKSFDVLFIGGKAHYAGPHDMCKWFRLQSPLKNKFQPSYHFWLTKTEILMF